MSARISSVRLEHVTKVFGAVRALAGVTLEIGAGEVVAVMGPNGAGKSTLLGILARTGLPTRGRLLVNREEVRGVDPELRGRIGLLSHRPLVYPDLTGKENLLLFARLHGLRDPRAAVTRLVEELALGDFASDRPTRVLSRGQLQRIALARALVADPDLLLLDEPAAGLDSAAVARIGAVLLALRERGGLAVVVTHEPEVASRVATRAVMLRRGAIAADEPAPGTADLWRALYVRTVEGGGR